MGTKSSRLLAIDSLSVPRRRQENSAIAGRTAVNFDTCVSNFSYSGIVRFHCHSMLSCWPLSADCSKSSVKKWLISTRKNQSNRWHISRRQVHHSHFQFLASSLFIASMINKQNAWTNVKLTETSICFTVRYAAVAWKFDKVNASCNCHQRTCFLNKDENTRLPICAAYYVSFAGDWGAC